MSGGVVTIGRRQYASGLYWENSPSGRVSQAAKEAARQPSVQASFYAVRVGNKAERVPQFGLSQEGADHRAGMPVLAACLANQQPGSWAGAFRLREGVAVVVVRDDLIVPDGDMFFVDETEARDRLLQEMAIGGLQRIFAPEAWGVSGADSMPVALLLNDAVDIRLRSVAMSRTTLMILGFLAFLLVVLLGIGIYLQKKSEQEELARLAHQEALRRAQIEAQKLVPGLAQPVYPPPERVWEKRPRPMDIINACNETLKKAVLTAAGWRLDRVRCDDHGLTQSWTRTGGFSRPPQNFVINDNVNLASVNIPHEKPLSPRGEEALVDPADISRRYLAQNWGGQLNRMPDDPPPPPPPDYKGPWNPPPVPWIKRSFTLSAPVLPWTLPDFLGDVPGIVIGSLSYAVSGTGGAWMLDGVIYENRH